MDIIDKLLSRIKVNERGCFEWQGCKNDDGYGRIVLNGKNCVVSRVSYEVFRGKIPGRLMVLHHCDNPPCCNPAHLFVGTHQDNSNDSKAKKRHSHGSKITTAIFRDKQITDIRVLHMLGWSIPELECRFDVDRTTMRAIVLGISWSHVPMPDIRIPSQHEREAIDAERGLYSARSEASGLNSRKPWTIADDERVLDSMNDQLLSREIKRTPLAINLRRMSLRRQGRVAMMKKR